MQHLQFHLLQNAAGISTLYQIKKKNAFTCAYYIARKMQARWRAKRLKQKEKSQQKEWKYKEMRLLCNISRNNAVNDDTYYA